MAKDMHASTGESWKDMAAAFTKLPDFQKANPTTKRLIARMDEVYPVREATGILDNGCGAGALISYILDEYGSQLPPDATIIGADFSEHMVKALSDKQKTRIDGGQEVWKRLQPRQIDAHDLSSVIGAGSLSHVVAGHVFFLLADARKALRQAHLVLQSGGILAISHGYESQHIDAIQDAVESVRPGTQLKMVRKEWSTEEATKAELEECGFEDVEIFFVDNEMGYEKIDDFASMLVRMPVMQNVVDDYSTDEKQRLVQQLAGNLRQANPKEPGKLRGRNLSAYTSYTWYIAGFFLVCGTALIYDSAVRIETEEPVPTAVEFVEASPTTSHDPFFTSMPIAPGHRGNLTADQEAKLRQLWTLTLHTFGVQDPNHPNGTAALDDTPTNSEAEGKEKKKKSRLGIFGRNKHDDHSASPKVGATDESDDKYGQVKEYHQILSTQTPESLRTAFWSMVKADHPDALLLRFLRARKWDVNKALVMLISTMSWRGNEMHVDDDVILHGELGALNDSRSSDAAVKREGHDFLEQMRLGKSFLHGADKEGRPLCIVRARLHHGGDQTEKSLERYTVFVIETARLLLRPPVETATILFDMTHFTMANMDYTPVKFMIKIFEANYPESLGNVLVHKAPWLFQGIWKIIKGWLDPVVAAKVHFTSSVEDLEQFIDRSKILKELGGDENWEYVFVEPQDGEDKLMQDESAKKPLNEERQKMVQEFEKDTFEWIRQCEGPKPTPEAETTKHQRDDIATQLHDNYWKLDPHIRARTLYDRVGMIEQDGKINFYPSHKEAKQTVEAQATNPSDVD
ncbi:CRAL-TRIO domain-containing protein C3H8.02 [Cyphellophora attinorum]|uniref:CRAL-TRIO domain-containing protein C3H8.02 n=1 Tax=Cyphellophora attinorum TaxID=1664694 RepID=A0A0N1H9V1_9EURO|nr:CRAL-TRIO domain-containing protein C3H8.02 [Phialophora attinorum]KPI40410.1 CRAL-TRIO domain-containing protein C3H8.02 [Phialophora attinorum]